MLLAIEVEAEELAVLAAELAVFVGIADLPVARAGVAGGDEELRAEVVEGGDDLGGGIVGAFFLSRPAGELDELGALFAFAEPDGLLEGVEVDAGSAGGTGDDQGFVVLGDPEGVGGVVAGEKAPEDVGIRVVVERE